jgi:hypothetical protein
LTQFLLDAHNALAARSLGWNATPHVYLNGTQVSFTYGHDLLAWDSSGSGPAISGQLTTAEDLQALEAHGRAVYAWGQSARPVVSVASDGGLAPLGEHDLALAERRPSTAVRIVAGHAQAAYVP